MLRKHLTYTRRYVTGTYQKLRLIGKEIGSHIHLAARTYAAAQPMLKQSGFDTSVFDKKLSAGYEAYKDLEEKMVAGDRAVQTLAAHLRPKFTPYS